MVQYYSVRVVVLSYVEIKELVITVQQDDGNVNIQNQRSHTDV